MGSAGAVDAKKTGTILKLMWSCYVMAYLDAWRPMSLARVGEIAAGTCRTDARRRYQDAHVATSLIIGAGDYVTAARRPRLRIAMIRAHVVNIVMHNF